jgi:hypothetical protein
MTDPVREATLSRAGQAWRDRLGGLAWFAAIPVTLWMLLALPLGLGPSLLVAAATIALHRPLASRFAYSRTPRRCLWCGGPPDRPREIRLLGVPPLFVCSQESERLARFLAFCARHGLLLRIGILAPVLGYFLLGALAVLGVEPLPLQTRQALFRGPIALSVVAVAVLHRLAPAETPERFPFPIHNLALLGVRFTLLVFLAVGVFWLWLTTRFLLGL